MFDQCERQRAIKVVYCGADGSKITFSPLDKVHHKTYTKNYAVGRKSKAAEVNTGWSDMMGRQLRPATSNLKIFFDHKGDRLLNRLQICNSFYTLKGSAGEAIFMFEGEV